MTKACWFGKAILNAFGGETAVETVAIDYLSNTIKVSLHTNAFTPNQDTMEFASDLTNEVAAGGGYATGGATLTGKTLGYDAGTNVIKFDANDVQWAASTITAAYAVIYMDTGVAATSPLMGYVDFEGDVISTNGDFDITWNAAGMLTITPAALA